MNLHNHADARDLPVQFGDAPPLVAVAPRPSQFARRIPSEAARRPTEAADALIAAGALVTGRTLITENWRDFHFIDDLTFVDIRGITTGDLPVLASRAVQTGGPVAGAGCCRKLIRSRAATSQVRL
jgi:hypothetical protein